ncbi:MAG: molybdate ABC transporter substrate-binding protein [Solirubrobacteraceae bacterium]
MRRSRRWGPATTLLVGVLVAAGCGGDDGAPGDSASAQPERSVVVSAAASLTEALSACRDRIDGLDPKLSFAGSDQLAAQIRQGVRPDVYLAANTKLPEALRKEGLLGEPIEFASNDLVLAVPEDSQIASLDDLTQDGVSIVLGSEQAPFGSYARTVLGRLPDGQNKALLANVRSEEPDVKSAVGKLLQGAADAGFTYNTDVTATDGDLKAIKLPESLRPTVAYGAGVVEGAGDPQAARKYLESVTGGACEKALMDAGFGPPPAS